MSDPAEAFWMAARPLESVRTARMMQACQTNMLVVASQSSSRQCARGIVNGTFITTSAAASTGMPSQLISWNG